MATRVDDGWGTEEYCELLNKKKMNQDAVQLRETDNAAMNVRSRFNIE